MREKEGKGRVREREGGEGRGGEGWMKDREGGERRVSE